ncbi:MAG: hypothetical protein KUG81_01470 [Gammaproteobacteria bacterium]|nr:hypothetical protein [Gammaproteobacteria bacterium]
MDLNEIKEELGLAQLNFNQGTEKDSDVKTDWFSHWDNTNRVRIGCHKDTIAKIQTGESTNLGLTKPEVKTGAKGKYTYRTLVAYNADVVM